MAQLRLLGSVICTVVGGKVVAVAQIDEAAAAAVLTRLGHRPQIAILIAYGALDSAAARRLGAEIGLLVEALCDR